MLASTLHRHLPSAPAASRKNTSGFSSRTWVMMPDGDRLVGVELRRERRVGWAAAVRAGRQGENVRCCVPCVTHC